LLIDTLAPADGADTDRLWRALDDDVGLRS
jgi:hypothetical protein